MINDTINVMCEILISTVFRHFLPFFALFILLRLLFTMFKTFCNDRDWIENVSVESETDFNICDNENIEKDFQNLWLCPYCDSLNDNAILDCPHCGAPRKKIS